MKNTILIFAFIFSISLANAQEVKPIFEKSDNKVKATYFHDNGKIAQVGHFFNGKLDGEWKMYNEDGDKIAQGNYALGQKTGKWFFWNDAILQEVDFKNSKIAHITKWNSEGTLVVK